MTNSSVRNDIQIDHVCSSAICQEIADRLLRTASAVKSDRLPQRIEILVEPLAGSAVEFPAIAYPMCCATIRSSRPSE